jgi:hypothetical protein
MFHERRIHSTLKRGIAYYIAHPHELLDFLLEGFVDQEATEAEKTAARDEATRARDDFLEKPPEPCHGYARAGGTFPCWAILLGQESTTQDFLGEDASNLEPTFDDQGTLDDEGEAYLDEDGNKLDMHVRRWGQHYDVYIYTNHPDKTLYHYYLCRQILVAARAGFQANGIEEITYTGAELAPDPRYLPENVFVRRFSIDCRSDQEYADRLGGVGAGRQLSAMQDDQGQSDPGGVTPNITAYEEQ